MDTPATHRKGAEIWGNSFCRSISLCWAGCHLDKAPDCSTVHRNLPGALWGRLCWVLAVQVCAWAGAVCVFCYERIYFPCAAVTAPRGRQGWEASDRIFVLHLHFVSLCQHCYSALPAQDYRDVTIGGTTGFEVQASELSQIFHVGREAVTSFHGCQTKETNAQPHICLQHLCGATPTLPAWGSFTRPCLGPRACRRAELGLSWAQTLWTGLSRASKGASSRLAEQLPPGQHSLGRGESDQQLQGDFKHSIRSGRDIYTPACSNMLHFLTL